MKAIPIVTSVDRKYLPGLIALHNSFIKNSQEGFEFWAILDGDMAFEREVNALGIKTILNPVMDTKQYPVSDKWPDEVPSMYWRMLIPSLFPEHDKSIYIDADAIILKSLKGIASIDIGSKVLGATHDKQMFVSTLGLPDDLANAVSFISSFMVFNHKQYAQKNILQTCLELMQRTDLNFKCAVQGVMQVAILSDWFEYKYTYQAHAGHQTLCDDSYILHFMGTNPWETLRADLIQPWKLKARHIWEEYT
tara:strand:- start:2307 stop:3056 length:750 start_codon:yes stop_codon:yes gene_type:complete